MNQSSWWLWELVARLVERYDPKCKECSGSGLVDYDDAHGMPRNAPCICQQHSGDKPGWWQRRRRRDWRRVP